VQYQTDWQMSGRLARNIALALAGCQQEPCGLRRCASPDDSRPICGPDLLLAKHGFFDADAPPRAPIKGHVCMPAGPLSN